MRYKSASGNRDHICCISLLRPAFRGKKMTAGMLFTLMNLIFVLTIHPGLSFGAESPDRMKIFVSVPPQAYFVNRIGGERVNVTVLLAPGENPSTFSPSPQEMAELARADLFFRTGVPFENVLMPKIASAMPGLRVVDTRQGIRLRHLDDHDHQHGLSEENDHGHTSDQLDPHVWMSPPLVKEQAKTIRDALTRIDPAGKDAYETGFTTFSKDLDRLHERLTKLLVPLAGREFFVYHPAFGYFAETYGLKQVPVEIEGKEPSPRHIADLVRRAREQGVRVIFVQPQFSPKAAQAIAGAIGGAVVPLDPLAEDYIANMEAVADALIQALLPKDSGQ